jgi:hypothetical protein
VHGTYSTYGDLTDAYILVGRSEWRDYFGHLAAHGRKLSRIGCGLEKAMNIQVP